MYIKVKTLDSLTIKCFKIFHGVTMFMIFIFIIVLFIYFYKSSKKFKKTPINLPSKIVFSRQTAKPKDTLGSISLDILSLGGHSELKNAQYDYETVYLEYMHTFNKNIDLQEKINNNLNSLGELSFNIMQELEKSANLLNKKTDNFKYEFKHNIQTSHNNVNNLKKHIVSSGHSGAVLLIGVSIGGLAAIGSWTFVSMFGVASTGTAIASLSGIAAYNATLAWFGGGALAVGGGGMAAGAVTLAAIAIIPAVLFATYTTHKKADEIKQYTSELEEMIDNINKQNQNLENLNQEILEKISILHKQYMNIKKANQHIHDIIYPYGVASKIKRDIKDFFNQDFYTKQEIRELNKLLKTIDEIYSLFISLQDKNKKDIALIE